jgi:ADP-L-glycero-D-manno-heptose 6-epimerase
MANDLRKYLVTGAAGFIGSRFIETCQNNNLSLISVDQLDFFENRSENRSLHFGEKIDRNYLIPWLKETTPRLEAIIHLGAITDTRETNWDALNQFNLEYSKSLWEYATRKKIPFIYASSAATYGDGASGYDDDETLISKLKPLNPYGESKQKFDLWALEQEKRGNHPPQWTGFKFFNVYGFGERHKGFMSSVVLHAFDQIQKTDQVTLFKSHRSAIPDGHQKRDFIYVEDVVNALHFAIERPIGRGIFNLGTGQARTFLDLARAVFKALGKSEKIEFVDTPLSIREKYQYFTEAKMDRLRKQGYLQPFTSLEEGVQKYMKKLVN